MSRLNFRDPEHDVGHTEADGIKGLYQRFDYRRPPFPIPEDALGQNPDYPEIDERDLWKIEQTIFEFDVDGLHLPQLDERHPLMISAKKLKEAQLNLEQSMDRIWDKNNSDVINAEKRATFERMAAELHEVFPNAIAIDNQDYNTPNYSIKDEKRDQYHHYIQKKLYFQNLICFLEQFKAYQKIDHKAADFLNFAQEFIDWTEVIQIGHIAYAAVRSAIHCSAEEGSEKDKRKRKDGGLTMNHIYAVCVDVINGYMEDLTTENDFEKRRDIFKKMKMGAIMAICHDYKEDYPHLADFLVQKLNEAFTWDTAIQSRLSSTADASINTQSNIMYRAGHGSTIMRGIDALTKPQKDVDKVGYLPRQIGALPIEERGIVLRVKAADRLNNLKTLRHQKVSTRIRTVLETPEIIKLIEEIEMHEPMLTKRKHSLIQSNLEECESLIAEKGNQEIETRREQVKAVADAMKAKQAA